MPVPRWFGPKRLNPAHQAWLVCATYPSFSWSRAGKRHVLRGTLQPQKKAGRYQVAICFSGGQEPRVYVREPEVDSDVPHLYEDGALCLFHPRLYRWHEGRIIARSIVPLAALWLYFYEKWQDLGTWLGPEAPH
jgi:hypothetical protein